VHHNYNFQAKLELRFLPSQEWHSQERLPRLLRSLAMTKSSL
jgi:hypothetical protein